jgi:hypothetical protein
MSAQMILFQKFWKWKLNEEARAAGQPFGDRRAADYFKESLKVSFEMGPYVATAITTF